MNKLPHIQFSGINKSYSKKRSSLSRLLFSKSTQSKMILDNTEIELRGGECILLTGKNGSGKSTLLRILAGMLKPDSATITTGLVSLNWKKARKMIRQHIMYLYQEPYMFDGTVTQNLKYAIHKDKTDITTQNPSYKSGSKYVDELVAEALEWANLEHRANTSAKCLSGGERQRVALAQAWLKQPSILLLDEPTANMDKESRHSTEDLLCKFKLTGTALLIASHDINHFHHTMDKRLLLKDGLISELLGESEDKDNGSGNPDKTCETSNVSLFPQKRVNP